MIQIKQLNTQHFYREFGTMLEAEAGQSHHQLPIQKKLKQIFYFSNIFSTEQVNP